MKICFEKQNWLVSKTKRFLFLFHVSIIISSTKLMAFVLVRYRNHLPRRHINVNRTLFVYVAVLPSIVTIRKRSTDRINNMSMNNIMNNKTSLPTLLFSYQTRFKFSYGIIEPIPTRQACLYMNRVRKMYGSMMCIFYVSGVKWNFAQTLLLFLAQRDSYKQTYVYVICVAVTHVCMEA